MVGACACVAAGSATIQTSCRMGTAVIPLQISKLVVSCFSAKLLCDSALLCLDDQVCFYADSLL